MIVHQGKNIEDVNQEFISYFLSLAKQCINENGRFNWVLTGGNSPRAVYSKLALAHADDIDWTKVYFFFGDERYVPSSSNEYNGKMADETLFSQLAIKPDQIFYMPTSSTPEEDALKYQSAIDKHFHIENPAERNEIKFDLIMLGMGDDAHTASLFPHTTATLASQPEVIAVWVEKLNTHRITFTAPLINQAKQVAFFCFGAAKVKALTNVWDKRNNDTNTYPAKLINPANGELHWFVDAALMSQMN